MDLPFSPGEYQKAVQYRKAARCQKAARYRNDMLVTGRNRGGNKEAQ
jgi:hypothetical protein